MIITPEMITDVVIKRLLDGSEVQPNGCRLWRGGVKEINQWLYPMINVSGTRQYARTIAWYIKHKSLPEKGGVSAVCGDPLCVEPEHMVKKINRRTTLIGD